jgi:integrase
MGNAKGRRRRFGAVRQLPSGQWQARYRGPEGLTRPAPQTFPTKISAERWLIRTEADLLDGGWIDPDAGLMSFSEYATAWIEERDLRPGTAQVYRYVLSRHLLPLLGSRAIAEITERRVRKWRKKLLDSGVSTVSAAKAYRLVKAIMNTAVDDGLIRRNPCRIKGAAQDRSPERSVLTPGQVFSLADAVDRRYRALILLALFASLRWGEVAALRRSDIDAEARTVRIARSLNELPGGGYGFGPPKTAAGRRVVAFSATLTPYLTWHLARFTAPDDDALVFTSPTGRPLRRGNFRRRVWVKAAEVVGVPEAHFHDLRHTGNNLTAQGGANLRELMERMGHSSPRAALIYLHATTERQRALADTVGTLIESTVSERASNQDPSGTDVARRGRNGGDRTKPRSADLG